MALADEQAQADFLALRAADILQRRQANPDRGRAIADVNRVGGIGALGAGQIDEDGKLVASGGGIEHGERLSGQAAPDKPITSKPRNSNRPAKRFERNSAKAAAPSDGSARAA